MVELMWMVLRKLVLWVGVLWCFLWFAYLSLTDKPGVQLHPSQEATVMTTATLAEPALPGEEEELSVALDSEAAEPDLQPLTLALVHSHHQGVEWEALTGRIGLNIPHNESLEHGLEEVKLLEYRMFMRILADRFGIDGFCFFHHWPRPQHPGGFAFFYQGWSSRHDTVGLLELMMMDGKPRKPFVLCWASADHAKNHEEHFYELLPYFKHPLYIRVRDRPVLFYWDTGINATDMTELESCWSALAGREGFHQGLLLVRLHSKHDSAIPATSGHILNRSGAKMVRSANPAVTVYEVNNEFSKIDSFERHVDQVFRRVKSDSSSIAGMKVNKSEATFVLINSWNGWQDESAIEPNDINGYDTLYAIKRVKPPKPSDKPVIVHMCHRGGGAETHVLHLINLFPDYEHLYVEDGAVPSPSDWNIVLLHIHSALVYDGPKWGVLQIARDYRASNVPVYLTLHDYQWLYPFEPNPRLEFQQEFPPSPAEVLRTALLFQLADRIIFPDASVVNTFQQYLLAVWDENKMHLVRHNDILYHSDFFRVPPIRDGVINIALVGMFYGLKGSWLFLDLANSGFSYLNFTLRYHQFGINEMVPDESTRHVTFHGEYEEEKLLQLLVGHDIHVVTFLSICPETYSYSLSRLLRSGVPMVYLNRGAPTSRLKGVLHTFPIEQESVESLAEGLTRTLDFVVKHQGTESRVKVEGLSKKVQPNRWYLSHYPHDF